MSPAAHKGRRIRPWRASVPLSIDPHPGRWQVLPDPVRTVDGDAARVGFDRCDQAIGELDERRAGLEQIKRFCEQGLAGGLGPRQQRQRGHDAVEHMLTGTLARAKAVGLGERFTQGVGVSLNDRQAGIAPREQFTEVRAIFDQAELGFQQAAIEQRLGDDPVPGPSSTTRACGRGVT